MKLHAVSFILLVIGGINWLLVGVAGWDIGKLFGDAGNPVERVIYILVGLAAIYEVVTHKKNCKMCEKMGSSNSSSTMAS